MVWGRVEPVGREPVSYKIKMLPLNWFNYSRYCNLAMLKTNNISNCVRSLCTIIVYDHCVRSLCTILYDHTITWFLGQDEKCWSGPTSRYNGSKATTKSGYTCQKWMSDVPHKPKHRPKDATEENNHNHCRYVKVDLILTVLIAV